MSASKWAYLPERCDGEPCPGDCDVCNLAEMDGMTTERAITSDCAELPEVRCSRTGGNMTEYEKIRLSTCSDACAMYWQEHPFIPGVLICPGCTGWKDENGTLWKQSNLPMWEET